MTIPEMSVLIASGGVVLTCAKLAFKPKPQNEQRLIDMASKQLDISTKLTFAIEMLTAQGNRVEEQGKANHKRLGDIDHKQEINNTHAQTVEDKIDEVKNEQKSFRERVEIIVKEHGCKAKLT